MLLRLCLTTAGVFLTIALSIGFAVAQTLNVPPSKHEPENNGLPVHPFHDPRGLYTLSIPAGWDLTMTGDDPTFHNGSSWIRVRFFEAANAAAAVDLAAAEFRERFTAFNTINRGTTSIAGRSSHGLNVDALTPGGQRVSVLLTAQPTGAARQFFVLISATPLAQAPQLNTSVMAFATSVRFSGH